MTTDTLVHCRSQLATHLVDAAVVVGETLFKKPRPNTIGMTHAQETWTRNVQTQTDNQTAQFRSRASVQFW